MKPDPEAVRATAERMRERYPGSRYTAAERATDHAMSYDAGTFGRAYWLAVVAELKRGAP